MVKVVTPVVDGRFRSGISGVTSRRKGGRETKEEVQVVSLVVVQVSLVVMAIMVVT